MQRTTLAASCLTLLLGLTGCAGTVYHETEYVERRPVVVESTVYVSRSHPHYYRHRPYSPVVVVQPRPYYRGGHSGYSRYDNNHRSHGEWAHRGDAGHSGGGSTGASTTGGGSTAGGVASTGSGSTQGNPADHHDNGRRAHGNPTRSADNHDYGRRGNGSGGSSEASAR